MEIYHDKDCPSYVKRLGEECISTGLNDDDFDIRRNSDGSVTYSLKCNCGVDKLSDELQVFVRI